MDRDTTRTTSEGESSAQLHAARGSRGGATRPGVGAALAGLLAFAGCEAGAGDTGDATTDNATSGPGETGAPTTGASEDTGQTAETGVDASTGEPGSSGTETGDDTTGETGATGETTADASTTDEGSTGEPVEEPEISGMYTDEYGSMHMIDVLAWNIDTSVFHVLAVDNTSDHLVARNDAANDFFPDLYSRFDWYAEGEDLYFCQTAYGALTEAEAEMMAPADVADLMMGCGGFPWTLLTP